MWKVVTTDEFDRWFSALGDDEQEEIDVKVVLLKKFGPRLSRPHADTLDGSQYANMKELRAATAQSALRIAFAFDPVRNAVLLIGGNKTGVNQRRFYKRLIAKADELYARYLENMKGEGHG